MRNSLLLFSHYTTPTFIEPEILATTGYDRDLPEDYPICEAGYENRFMALPSGKLASPCGSEYLIAGKDPSMRFTLINAHIGHGPLRPYWNYCRTIVAGIWIHFYCQYQSKVLRDPSVHMLAGVDRLLCHCHGTPNLLLNSSHTSHFDILAENVGTSGTFGVFSFSKSRFLVLRNQK